MHRPPRPNYNQNHNLTLSTDRCPMEFKDSVVKPLLKKPSLDKNSSQTTAQSRFYFAYPKCRNESSRVGFGYGFGAETAKFLGFGMVSVTAVTRILVSVWFRLRP